MPTRSHYATSSMHVEKIDFVAAVVGAGASAPTIPAATVITAADNFAASATRSGTGTYVITLKEKFPSFVHIDPMVVGSDGKRVQVTSWSVSAGTISVQAYNVSGVAADLTTGDTLRLLVQAKLGV